MSLVLTWFSDSGDSVFSLVTVTLSICLGILSFVALPACICCLCFKVDESIDSCCNTRVTFFVAIIVACSIALIGTFVSGLLQIFYTTYCIDYLHLSTNIRLGGGAIAVNFVVAILSLFVMIFTFVTCFKDDSRRWSDACSRTFIILTFMVVSSLAACFYTDYILFSYALGARTESDATASTLDGQTTSVWAALLATGASCFLVCCSCIAGPILCREEVREGGDIARSSGIVTIVLSLVNAGNILAGILMIISGNSFSNEDLEPSEYNSCRILNQSSYAAMAFVAGVVNFTVVVSAMVASCFGCYYAIKGGSHQQE